MIYITPVDFSSPQHQVDFWKLLNMYATDLMGGGNPIDARLQQKLFTDLQSSPIAYSFLAYDENKLPVGLLNSFLGYSTFNAAPLLNIHDLVVHPEYRGKGIAKQLMRAAENQAKDLGCCKLTLEVLENNAVALGLYFSLGFNSYELDPAAGKALFLDKKVEGIHVDRS